MAGSLIKLTNAGRTALVGPGNIGTVTRTITKIGVATAAFVPTEELLALPNERKQLDTFGGENVAPDTVHVTLRDDTNDQYTLYGYGLYLDNGVLLGTYSQDTPVLEKSPAAILLLSTDMRFTTIDAALLQFGSADWTNPPATELRQGVVELATAAETQTGADGTRAVTPAALSARTATDTRTGLVELATDAEAQTGTDTSRAVTPANLSARTATEARTGLAAIASQAEANTAADDSKIITPKKMGVYVAAAVAALVNSSPAALDTLKELADAIGDDANFSVTMTNALALKAPLASPAMTGTPTVPTAAAGTSTMQAASTDFVQQAIGSGCIAFFARNTPPPGWLKANGAAVSRSVYAALFAAIGTWWGAGDGATTFNVPDLRGEFPRGWDDARGADPGRAFASGQASQNLAHTHGLSYPSSGLWGDAPGRFIANAGGTDILMNNQYPTITSAGGSEARPRNVALLACIKI
ncbi:hypothetical protein CNECB9_5260029 [Cupriavidus necator]|uniref:Phage tail collar domain-containing protein n=1 Tax=Cupriavidus necator TaxID=106590 RepID=A0A1K0IP40_CUPNE|nr:hypothetical protein CNECB9_5260029 [Cupriavidus necator]